MKAVGYYRALNIEDSSVLLDLDLSVPTPTGRDLLIEVRAVSVNPVDTKVRRGSQPAQGEAKVLGWDATGVVRAAGDEVSSFKVGDPVWYAGSITRLGSNAEYQLVDERIVGRMPNNLGFAEAAALPLTSITSWELLFDRLQVQHAPEPASILVIGASGGVGSVLVQLARTLTPLTIIATASRPESQSWLQSIGAHHVINHHQPMQPQLEALNLAPPDYVVSLNKTEQHFAQVVELIKPQGKFALIDDPEMIDVRLLKRKSISLHWEMMFTRALFNTADMQKQHELLNQMAELVEQGKIKTTLAQHLGKINAANLKRAHAMIESGTTIGKIVLEGF